MLNLSDEEKNLFYKGGVFKDYEFLFDDIDLIIANDTIHQESVTIKESIIEDNEFVLGGCIASSCEFEVSEIIDYDINGLEFQTKLSLTQGNVSIPMGKYRVNSAKRVDDKDYKKVIAYDALYDASVDVSLWFDDFFDKKTHTVKETRESVLEYLKIPYESQTLKNDDFILSVDTYDGMEIYGTTILQCLCSINAGFGRMNRNGKFEVTFLNGYGLYPEEKLYPEETLYPEDDFVNFSEAENSPNYITTSYEEYRTKRITSLIIQNGSDDKGISIGDDRSNPYIMRNNFLLYNKTEEELKKVGNSILENIKEVVYIPNVTVSEGIPYLEVGDTYALIKNTDIVESYVFSRTLSGVQCLRDEFESKGEELRTNEKTLSDKVKMLDDRSNELEKSIEETKEDINKLEVKTTVRFEKTEESIEAEVTRAKGEENSLSSRISITADAIKSEVTRAKNAEETLSSRIVQTSNEITAEVSRASGVEDSLNASLSLKIDKDDNDRIVSMINASADIITLNSNRLVVNSSNFTLDSSGNATFSGKLNAAHGSFTGLTCTSANGSISGLYGLSSQYANFSQSVSVGAGLNAGSITSYGGLSVDGDIRAENSTGTFNIVAANYVNCGKLNEISDANEKIEINDISEKIAFDIIDNSSPKKYRLIQDPTTIYYGIIAQDTERKFIEKGIRENGITKTIRTKSKTGKIYDKYMVSYTSYIAPLIKYCQVLKRELDKEIAKREKTEMKIFEIEGKIMLLRKEIENGNFE